VLTTSIDSKEERMNRIHLAAVALTAALAALGCSRNDQTDHAGGSGQAPAPTSGEAAAPATPEGQPADAVMGAEVQVAGVLGCGHCNYHVTADCAAVVRTANGDTYVLDGVDETSDLWAKRMEPNHKITVSGKIVGVEPVKHVAMTSFELD
jgi:hypothetical protein